MCFAIASEKCCPRGCEASAPSSTRKAGLWRRIKAAERVQQTPLGSTELGLRLRGPHRGDPDKFWLGPFQSLLRRTRDEMQPTR